MPQNAIPQEDLRALELMDFVLGKFEADAGFELPGLSASEIRPEMAQASGAGIVDAQRMRAMAERGLLTRVAGYQASEMYALSPEGMRLLRA